MSVRVRLKEEAHTGYRVKRFSDKGTEVRGMMTLRHRTEDVTGKGDNLAFESDRTVRSGGLINGNERSNRTGYNWFNYPSYWQDNDPAAISHVSVPLPDYGDLATTVLKRSNPSRASIDALVSIVETREIPGLIRDGWRLKTGEMFKHISRSAFRRLRKTAKINLMIQFGILPLVSDLEKTLRFQQLVDQRVEELRRLQERGLRRTYDLGTFSGSSSYRATLQSQGVRLHADISKKTTVKLRGHARWHVFFDFYKSEAELRAKARQIIANQWFDPQAMWELMPWSWLVDYFSNFGDWMSLTRNKVGALPESVRIMTHSYTQVSSSNHSTSNRGQVTCTPIENVRDTKKRQIVPAGLSAQLEFLNESQWSILASLSVLKSRR